MIKRKRTLGTSGLEWVFLALMALGLGFGLPGSRGGDVFFERFEDACLVVLEDAIPGGLKGAFSVAISRDSLQPDNFHPMPPRMWERLSARLKAKGADVSGYVPADKVRVRKGAAYEAGTDRAVTVWCIAGISWLGDHRLRITQQRFRNGLDGGMHTAVLEFVDGAWVVVARTHQGMAGVDEAREAEARASARVRVGAVPRGGLLWRTGFLLAGPDAGSVGFEQCTVGEGFCRRMGHGSVGGRGYRT